jgi:hypothetical protein
MLKQVNSTILYSKKRGNFILSHLPQLFCQATSEHVPTLVVPCGHTVCKRCATSHTGCRLCGTRVASITTNIMLQQIIHEFHRKNHQTSVDANQGGVATRYTAKAGLAGGERHDDAPKTTSKNVEGGLIRIIIVVTDKWVFQFADLP